MVPVHLASNVADKIAFSRLLDQAAYEVFGDWRTADRYLNLPLERFLEKWYGLLMTAPQSFATLAAVRADDLGVKLDLHERNTSIGRPKVLLMGKNFVVGDVFGVEKLEKVESVL
ncbi:MAG: hypothetical protein ABJB34_06985 [Acidobacteriota bacterium]